MVTGLRFNWRAIAAVAGVAGTLLGSASDAAAQLDPLLFLKSTKPNVLLVVETANRMQRDADNDYYDPFDYTKANQPWETTLGVTLLNTVSKYRRKYVALAHQDQAAGNDKFKATTIAVTGDLQSGYSTFEAKTRLSVARTALIQAVQENTGVARFGLLRMRQLNPQMGTQGNEGPVKDDDPLQFDPTDRNSPGKWNITRPVVDNVNGSNAGIQAPVVLTDAATANADVVTILNRNVRTAGALIPAGRDSLNVLDAPVKYMLDDARSEAARLIAADTQCRNTVVVLVVGGKEGTTAGNPDPAVTASTFLNVSSRRVPVYVIAIAPPAADVAQLQAIATTSGGQYVEITKAMIDAVAPGTAVPEVVHAVNLAVQHTFASQTDFNTAPTVTFPFGPPTEFLVTSPIIGTVNLANAKDINGAALPNTVVFSPSGALIPQRSNVEVTSGFSVPGFDGKMRAFRVYKPVVDTTKPAGYKFVADGTKLWVASTPVAASRNIYTVEPDGTIRAFTTANASVLAPYMNLSTADATNVIDFVRNMPLGAVVGSTPAIMDTPSLDPPPDTDYPGFADANKSRRGLIWVGANDGMLHAIDSRLGVEVWAFIPFNLLPKLRTLRDGQPVDKFDYFVDSSPKLADVKIAGVWRTYLFLGEGPGGTFYQAFDVTLDNIAVAVTPDSDVIASVLTYFADPSKVAFKWSFPSYSNFDYTLSTSVTPYGDLKATATAVEKTVGETWSDPAVGQIQNTSSKFAVLTASGFLKYSVQQQANRGGARAGTTFYLLNAETGAVFDSRDVGTDNVGETVDNCAAANDCTKIKNALQADPVATGPVDSRFISKAYIGDLDGKVWRFDLSLNVSLNPIVTSNPTLLFTAPTGSGSGAAHPIFASMATVNVGGTQDYLFFGTGSDLLPSNGVNQAYQLIGVLDTGPSGTKKFGLALASVDGAADDEKVTAFPAVAGDIVFFTTTSFKPASLCTAPDANLYAVTFVGGPAYDNTGDDRITASDTAKVKTIAGSRATAPFIVDQHLVFAAGNKLETFGDPNDFNNGVGQVGVRTLSWREVR